MNNTQHVLVEPEQPEQPEQVGSEGNSSELKSLTLRQIQPTRSALDLHEQLCEHLPESTLPRPGLGASGQEFLNILHEHQPLRAHRDIHSTRPFLKEAWAATPSPSGSGAKMALALYSMAALGYIIGRLVEDGLDNKNEITSETWLHIARAEAIILAMFTGFSLIGGLIYGCLYRQVNEEYRENYDKVQQAEQVLVLYRKHGKHSGLSSRLTGAEYDYVGYGSQQSPSFGSGRQSPPVVVVGEASESTSEVGRSTPKGQKI